MKPKELLFSRQYYEAVSAIKRHMNDHPNDNYYSLLGDAQLCLKHYRDALLSYKRSQEMEQLMGSFSSLNQIGTTLWRLSQRKEAVETWHRAVVGIQDGSIKYGDLAGGGTQGLLLWYGAITMKNDNLRDCALDYLRSIMKRKVYAPAICWPRPVISMVLGKESLEEVLRIGNGSPVLSECLEKAGTDLLKRRHLCQTLFYVACLERQTGNEGGCIENMRLCSHLDNPILECEWYLARYEYSP